MTVWDKIYKDYQAGGEAYATLRPGLDPEFLVFIKNHSLPNKSVLDIGCGHGKYLVFLQELGFQVFGLDSSPTAVQMSREALGDNSLVSLADMYGYDLPLERYGLIISIAALHHGLKAPIRELIKRIHSSLVLGGRFYITLPDNEGSTHWTMMIDHEEIEPGTRVPLSGAEKGLPHSSFTAAELDAMFSSFKVVDKHLLADRGRWIVSGEK